MNILKYPSREEWQAVCTRPHFDNSSLRQIVTNVLDSIRQEGDVAVRRYEKEFDKVDLSELQVSEVEMAESDSLVSEELKAALLLAHQNISRFHASQTFESKKVETCQGVTCWQKAVPVEKVGLYIPGGTAPLFSTVLMLATPARIAGCSEIVLCTPPNREGKVNPAILQAAKIAGVSKIFKIGGVQAIGAMAYGTESVPKVYKIFGPGNQFVVCAKQIVSVADVAIDMPAGPSEVEVVADGSANPAFVAADLLSQAEHGVDSQVLLVTTSETLIQKVCDEIDRQLSALPRKDIASKSLENSHIVLLHDIEEVMELTNAYAPEHLILAVSNAEQVAEQVRNAGSVFIGNYSCESAGDYASGTNHTLPTNGYAKAYSGVCLDSFMKKITFQQLTAEGIRTIGPAVIEMAHNEQLDAHRNAMAVRLKEVNEEI